jgi:hypothetical protein
LVHPSKSFDRQQQARHWDAQTISAPDINRTPSRKQFQRPVRHCNRQKS